MLMKPYLGLEIGVRGVRMGKYEQYWSVGFYMFLAVSSCRASFVVSPYSRQ
jgi:hypothetical protein